MNFIAMVIGKLTEIVVAAKSENPNRHPKPMLRKELEGFLRITQGELVESFGVKNPKKLTVTVRKAMAVLARIHKGSDSYRVIAEKAEVLIKRLQPLHKAELERQFAARQIKAQRLALEQRFHTLSGGKALPDGIELKELNNMVVELREEFVATIKDLMEECADSAYFHPEPGRISDRNLVELRKRLNARAMQLRVKRPVTQRPFSAALAAGITLH